MYECANCGAPCGYRFRTGDHQFCSADCQAAAPGDDAPIWDPLIKAPPSDTTKCPF